MTSDKLSETAANSDTQETTHALKQHINELEARVESLESQIAFQEDTIQQLNSAITDTNLQFSVVTRQIELLAQKLKESKGSNIASMTEETPPPHY